MLKGIHKRGYDDPVDNDLLRDSVFIWVSHKTRHVTPKDHERHEADALQSISQHIPDCSHLHRLSDDSGNEYMTGLLVIWLVGMSSRGPISDLVQLEPAYVLVTHCPDKPREVRAIAP